MYTVIKHKISSNFGRLLVDFFLCWWSFITTGWQSENIFAYEQDLDQFTVHAVHVDSLQNIVTMCCLYRLELYARKRLQTMCLEVSPLSEAQSTCKSLSFFNLHRRVCLLGLFCWGKHGKKPIPVHLNFILTLYRAVLSHLMLCLSKQFLCKCECIVTWMLFYPFGLWNLSSIFCHEFVLWRPEWTGEAITAANHLFIALT